MLHDPTLPPGAIVEEYDDGGALRNDGVRLKPANQNPWYVLATLHGEQPKEAFSFDHDTDLADRNREAWNRWAKDALDDAAKDELLRLFRARLNDKTTNLPDPSDAYDFSNTHFLRFTCFEGFSFENRMDLHASVFNEEVRFKEATFNNYTVFDGAVFNAGAEFCGAVFGGNAVFFKATFNWATVFSEATFIQNANFLETTFHGATRFTRATFYGPAWFDETAFSGDASFPGVTFFGCAFFNSATFEGTTSFENARFLSHVPEFHATEFFEDTVFPIPDNPEANWPPQSGYGVMPADAQKRAYSRLRLFFAKTQQIDEEQFFHRQEMRCKRELAKGPTKALYSIYGVLSDYGISIWRPLMAMATLAVIGAALLSFHLGMQGQPPQGSTFWQGMGWSIANMLPFTGFGRTYFGPEFYRALPTWLKMYAGAQTLAAIPLLFLLGLGLRNSFRLR